MDKKTEEALQKARELEKKHIVTDHELNQQEADLKEEIEELNEMTEDV